MKYCKLCVQPDTRPAIDFTEDGICMACKIAGEKDKIDWVDRRRKLHAIAQQARRKSKGFDCVIGVSGGKDSHRQALVAKHELKLKCLLVCQLPESPTSTGVKNMENLVKQGFDLITYTPNPDPWRKLIRHAFFKYLNPVKPTEYPLWSFTYHTALNFDIPLVIQGENPAESLGTTKALAPDGNALNVDMINTNEGLDVGQWLIDDVDEKDLIFYQYPEKATLQKKVSAVFIGHYLKEWGHWSNTFFSAYKGVNKMAIIEAMPEHYGKINPYASIDAANFHSLNQMLKYYKFGFGFVTDETCYAIREGIMSRETAIALVEKYDGMCNDDLVRWFCNYVDIPKELFWATVRAFLNKNLFDENLNPKFKVGLGVIK